MYPTDSYEVSKILKAMQAKKSTGHDGISTKILKSILEGITEPIAKIINSSLSEGIVPDQMKVAKVVPIFKSKDKQLLNNYRPISLLPSISKILEKVVHKRLYSYFTLHDLFYDSQYGFRPKHSTINAVTEFTHDTLVSFEQQESTLAVYLDLSKAFDTINHDILIQKLQFYGVRGTSLDWFKSYLSDRSQFVKFNNCESITLDVKCGVPQGSVLGPLQIYHLHE